MSEGFDPRRIHRLENTIQEYAWGSPTAVPELLGRPNPGGKPQAEMWMGAHPKAPSRVVVEGRLFALSDLLEREPIPILGRQTTERFGSRLPFLFKVLSAAKALSIQAHPNRAQAIEGFRNEERAGIPRGAPDRNYRDDNHKPELLCALGEFWGMSGFRPIPSLLGDLSELDSPKLSKLAELLTREAGPAALRRFVAGLLAMEPADARMLVEEAADRCVAKQGERYRWVERLATEFPGDIGAVAPLFLNLVHLSRGQAIYQKAGELHAYLEGTAVELMANSDNVLRGGLTEKHVDVAELLRILAFEAGPPGVVVPRSLGGGVEVYDTPTTEFRLSRIAPERGTRFTAGGIRSVELLLCVRGNGALSWPDGKSSALSVGRGDSFLVPAAVASYAFEGDAELFRADLPLATTSVGRSSTEDLG